LERLWQAHETEKQVMRLSQNMRRVNRSRDAESLCKACKREGCPICIVVLEEMERAMDTWNYEGFSDVEDRHALIRSRGFCPLHTWQLAARHNTFQLALVYEGVLTEMLKNLEREIDLGQATLSAREAEKRPERQSWWQRWSGLWGQAVEARSLYARCPFCRTRAKVEQRIVETLAELLPDQEMQAQIGQSTGLCRLHLAQVAQAVRRHGSASFQVLLACQRVCLERTASELREQIRKHDYRFGQEPRGQEMTAWRRGAELTAGNPGVH
jgi:hypothetical protein